MPTINEEIAQFWTPRQQIMMRIYNRVFEPINRFIRRMHARLAPATVIFQGR